ncbi:uncharacterized protein LOC114722365 [Neltuma alba]|uniref:uncharacterized protein LOC114722365 n=1 Tax=Neltuma alba TaxID=207710 RepID=UPI0010A4BF80|nr:uncharacterized protein LOC114722365 [Prosopis alba]
MATDRDSAQGKREASGHIQLEEKEAEALSSLCDVPINSVKEDERSIRKADSQVLETNEEFDFRLWGGSLSKEPKMCAADEVFFQGQILPLQLNNQIFNRYKSRSLDYLDHGSLSESRSNSSRSNSFKSQNSSNSTGSTIILTPRVSVSESRVKNRFHTYPSPKPQLRVPLPRQASFGNVGQKSSTWDFFRLGVVPVPEIELQDLKVRGTKNPVSRHGSTSNNRSNCGTTKSGKMSTSTHYRDKSNYGLKQLLGKGGGLLSGCRCSIEMPLDTVIINSRTNKSTKETESATRAMKEKVVIEFDKEKQRRKQGKKAVSCRRQTFEWLKELSHASYPDDEEEALLLNS